MKQVLLFFCLLVILSCSNTQQEGTQSKAEDVANASRVLTDSLAIESAIGAADNNEIEPEDCTLSLERKQAFIRDKFSRINADSSLTKKEFPGESEGDFFQSQTLYYGNGKLVKLVDEGSGDLSTVSTAYYFWNGKLIFVYYRNEYQFEKSSVNEERIYYCNERPFKYLKNKVQMPDSSMQEVGLRYYQTWMGWKDVLKP